MQRVECEYKRFGCAVVLPRKDMSEHLKTSVEGHLWITKRRVEEMEICLQEEKDERQLLEARLKERGREQKRAEKERQRMNDVIACLVDRVEQLELKK